jgi:hypothetical protein
MFASDLSAARNQPDHKRRPFRTPNDRGSRTHFSVHHRQTAGFWLEAGRDRGPGFVGTPVAGIPVPRRRENAERYTGPYANGDVAFSYTL